jgi:hypothetical protein
MALVFPEVMHPRCARALDIPEIATAVFSVLDDRASLLAAALTCRSWAPVTLDLLWREPADAAMSADIHPYGRRGYAAAVQSLRLTDPFAALDAVLDSWTFPFLQHLRLPCDVLVMAPDDCCKFIARCGRTTLRSLAFEERGSHENRSWRQHDGRYDAGLELLLAELALRDGLEELYIGTAITQHLYIPTPFAPPRVAIDAGSPYIAPVPGCQIGAHGSSHYDDNNQRRTLSPTCPFGHLLRLRIDIADIVGGLGCEPLPPISLLRPELLGRVTELYVNAEYADQAPGSILEAVSNLLALRSLFLKLPCRCRISVGQVAQLGRLFTLRHLIVGCDRWGVGIEDFPDTVWAQLVASWPRLQTLSMSAWWGLTGGEHTLRVIGAACRELVELHLSSFDGHLGGLSASGDVLPDNALGYRTSAAAAAVATGCGYKGKPGGGRIDDMPPNEPQCDVVFPKLKALRLHSTGLDLDGTKCTLWLDECMVSMSIDGGVFNQLRPGPEPRASALAGGLLREAPNLSQFS